MMRPKNLKGKSRVEVWLMQLLRYVDSIKSVDSADIVPSRSSRGTTHQFKRSPGGGDGGNIQRFKITSVSDDWVVCRKVDKDEAEVSTTDYKVMRPIKLRGDQALPSSYKEGTLAQSGSQNRTFDQSISGTDYTVTQEIYPPYAADDLIYGANKIIGGTEDDGAGIEMEWIDLNVDGRHWQYSMREIEVCVNNAIKKAIAQISEGED